MKLFFKLILREFKLFGTNGVLLAIFIGGPIIYALLIGSVYKEAAVKELPAMVIDLDNTPLSNNIIDALDDNEYVSITNVVNYAKGNIRDTMLKKGYIAIITIPERFEADIQQKRHPEIDVDIDAGNMVNANYMATGVQVVLGSLNAGIEIESLKKKGMPATIAEDQYESFKINLTRFFNPSSNYLLFLWPGMLGTIMQQVFLLALALTFAKEFESHSFKNLLRYSKNTWFILFGKSVPYWLIGISLWVALLEIMFPLFHVQHAHHLMVFYLVTLFFIFSLTYIGIAASILLKTQLKATEVLMIVATPSFIISGQVWPSSHMPQWVQLISDTIPLTHYLEAFRKLMLYDANLADVWPQLRALIILSGIFFTLAFFALKWKINRQIKFHKLSAR
jgi:ABC-2 type transport system permease protein